MCESVRARAPRDAVRNRTQIAYVIGYNHPLAFQLCHKMRCGYETKSYGPVNYIYMLIMVSQQFKWIRRHRYCCLTGYRSVDTSISSTPSMIDPSTSVFLTYLWSLLLPDRFTCIVAGGVHSVHVGILGRDIDDGAFDITSRENPNLSTSSQHKTFHRRAQPREDIQMGYADLRHERGRCTPSVSPSSLTPRHAYRLC